MYILDDGLAFKIDITHGYVAARLAGLQTGNPRLINTVATVATATQAVETHLPLPVGFTYTTGSTTGATTADPTVIGQTLTWAGPFTVPATSSSSLHFGVTVSSTPGQYSNQAGATSSALAVAPTGPTAAVTVTGVPGATPTLTVATSGTGAGTVTSTPAGISCGAACSTTAPTGTTFTLTATPAAGSVLTGWTGGGCTGTGTCVMTLGADTTVTATFTAVPDISIISPQGTVMTLVATTGVVMLCRRRQRCLARS